MFFLVGLVLGVVYDSPVGGLVSSRRSVTMILGTAMRNRPWMPSQADEV